jgi:outer membrane protein assembly factor BamB
MGAIKIFPKIFYNKISLPAEKLIPSIYLKLITSIFILLILSANLFLLTNCEDEITQPPPKPPGYQEDIPWPSLADSPWPMGNHDPQNTGRSQYSGPTSGQIIDSIPAYNLQAGCVVGPDSTLYFITSNNAVLNAVTLNGNIKWQRTIAVESVTTPLIDKNNRIYAAGGRSLFCFTSSGDTVWEFQCDGRFFVSYNLNIDKNGNLYIIDDTHTLFSISPTGQLNWKFTDTRIPPYSIHSPAFSPDGKTIYIQGDQVSLIALDINSVTIKWTFGDEILYSGPVVDCQGNIYLLPEEDLSPNQKSTVFYSLTSDGSIRYSFPFKVQYPGIFDKSTIDKMGNLYFGKDTLYSLSYEGDLKWKKRLDLGAIYTSIISDARQDIYLGTDNKSLESYNPLLELNWSININHLFLQFPTILFDGSMIINAGNNNYLFFIR